MTNLEQLIEKQIVITSYEAIDYCVNILKISNEAARKRLQRISSNHIYKVKGICADKKVILWYKDIIKDEIFYEKLVSLLKLHAQQHYYVINALKINYGKVKKLKLASYSISPVEKCKGHKPFYQIILDLKQLELVDEEDEFYVINDKIMDKPSVSNALSLIQNITLNQFHKWIQNTGLISYNKAQFDSSFSTYQFGIVAPSYIKTLTRKPSDKITPAFLIADIVLNREVSSEDIQYFIKKVENAVLRNKSISILPFLIVSTHNPEVHHLLKKNGIIIGNIDELFGASYSETVFGIMDLLINSVDVLQKRPECYLKLIDNIEKLAIGKMNNLKGELFEMAVGYYHSKYCQILEISKKITIENTYREVDVYAVSQEKVIFAECKGRSSEIEDEYIDNWVSDTIPRIYKTVNSWPTICGKKIVFEIWCTGGFTQKSNNLLISKQEKTKRYEIHFYDLNDMYALARKANMKHLKDVFSKYYSKKI